jgi:hypothetical protein
MRLSAIHLSYLFFGQTPLYMLIQHAGSGARHSPRFTSPPWSLLSSSGMLSVMQICRCPCWGPAKVALGRLDPEDKDADKKSVGDVVGHAFSWDNKSPQRLVDIGPESLSPRKAEAGVDCSCPTRVSGSRTPDTAA